MKRKNPRLPNGYGSIKYLGKGRSNPYAVFAPSKENNIYGKPIYKTPIAYTDSWNKAFSVLVMHHAGTYKKGDLIPDVMPNDLKANMLQEVVNEVIKKLVPKKADENGIKFKEVYQDFFDYKYNQDKREYSLATMASTKAAFSNCKALHNRSFKSLKYKDLQQVIDICPLKHSSKELIVSLFHQMYKYAIIHELVEKDYSLHVSVQAKDDDIHGVPFSPADIKKLYECMHDETAEMLIIMCFSGFRISEYINLETNLKDMYFKGGSKTDAGKNRIVPIHPFISGIVKERLKRNHGKLLNCGTNRFRLDMYSLLSNLGIEKHTPHDCRHTFSYLCDKYSVNEVDKKRMLGHAFSDVTNKVYGHADLEKLKFEIEKIKLIF